MKLDVKFISENQIIDSKFSQINNISDGGYERGYAAGETVGYTNGYTEGKARGIEQGYEMGFTDGNVIYYKKSIDSLFARAEFENNDLVVKLKYFPTSFLNAFLNARNINSVKFIFDSGVNGLWYLSQTFRECDLRIIDFGVDVVRPSAIGYMFFGSHNIKTIKGVFDLTECEEIVAGNDYAFFTGILEDVEFVPNSIPFSIRFTSSKLTKKSILSIVNGLSDAASGKALKISRVSVNNTFSTAEWDALIATKPNWTFYLQ